MFERFAASARQTVQVACRLAREQGVDELREEHLLQALLTDPDTAGLLAHLGVSSTAGGAGAAGLLQLLASTAA